MSESRNGSNNSDLPDSIGAATRALADATSSLAKVLGEQASNIGTEVQETVAQSLRMASVSLGEAAERTQKQSGSRKKKVDQTRNELIAAATQVFAEKGYEGASVGDIAAAAGYTKGALYANFKSKEALFMVMVQEVACRQLDLPQLNPPDTAAIADWLERSTSELGSLISLEILSYSLRHPDSAAKMPDSVDSVVRQIAIPIAAYRLGIPQSNSYEGADSYEGVVPDQGDLETSYSVVALANQTALYGQTIKGKLVAFASPSAIARMIAADVEANAQRKK